MYNGVLFSKSVAAHCQNEGTLIIIMTIIIYISSENIISYINDKFIE